MCFIEARSTKPKIKPKTTKQTSAPALQSFLEEGPRIHVNLKGTSEISFPAISVSKIPHCPFNHSSRAPNIVALQSSSESQSTPATSKLQQQTGTKPLLPLSTSISAHGNEIVKGAEELHRLVSRLEDASADCSRSSKSSRWSRRSRSTDQSRGSNRSREQSERRRDREMELKRELERERGHIHEWGREWEKQKERDRHREILTLKALEHEKSNADKIKELKRERKMEKVIASEIQSQIQKISTHISLPVHGLGNRHGFRDLASSSHAHNALHWGAIMDNESAVHGETIRARERERRERRGSLWEVAIGNGTRVSYGSGGRNGGGDSRNRHTDAGGAGSGAGDLHYHDHSHTHLHYNDLPSGARGGKYEYDIIRATARDRERRKSSIVSVVSVMGGGLVRRFLDGWARVEREGLVAGEKTEREREKERERRNIRGRERELEQERGRVRYGSSGLSYGYGYEGRDGPAGRCMVFDL